MPTRFSFLGKFAPKNLMVFVQLVLSIGWFFLSRLTKTNIAFAVPGFLQIIWSIMLGLLISSVAFWGARVFVQFKRVLDWIFEEFSEEDDWLWVLLAMAVFISVGEELFFRGFLQPNLGLLITSFVFSLFHFRTNVKSMVVMPFAFFLGLIFGQSYLLTENIFIPMVIHFSVLFSLGVICQIFLRKDSFTKSVVPN